MTLTGGTQAWIQAGLPLETGSTRMAHQADDVFLSPRERGQNREDAMREYLTWEINLVNGIPPLPPRRRLRGGTAMQADRLCVAAPGACVARAH
jgi:hypothetical protein